MPPETASPPASPRPPVRFGAFVLDAAQARLQTLEGEALSLNGRPFELLAVLASQPGQLMDKDSLLDAVWGHRHVSESVLKGAINTVRLALGDDAKAPLYIETVPRRGYRFVATVADAPPPVGVAQRARSPQAAEDEDLQTARGNMPLHVERPIGRETEMAVLLHQLGEHRLVTLTGLGGVGKTCLALALAARVAEPAGGRWLMRLDELSDPGLVLPTLAQLLHLGRAAAASADTLARAMADQQLLLVLDNAEHLVDAVAELCAALLAQAPEVQLLVTSQLPLRLAAETVLPLAPLALPDIARHDPVQEVGQGPADAAPAPDSYAAARLLSRRIRQHQPQWQPAPTEHADIAAICRALDGVPLALELAAARVPLLGLSGVRARLDQRFQLLTRPSRDTAPRQRTLSAALAWSFGLLGDAERQALQQLAVFAGSFSLADAEGVLGDEALDAVEELRARSLLVAEHGHPGQSGLRLRLFDSVRRHALQALKEAGEEPEARMRHLAWMGERLQSLWQTDLFEPYEDWLPALRLDADSLREALRFGLSEAAPPQAGPWAVGLAADLARYWPRLGLYTEGWRWLDAAQARCGALGDTLEAGVVARLNLARACFCGGTQQGDPRQALAGLEQAMTWVQAQVDPLWAYVAAGAECDLVLRVHPDRLERLDALIERMAALLQPLWPPLAQRQLWRLQASISRLHGDFETMLRRMDQYEALCLAHGAQEAALQAVFLRLQALSLLGRWDQARSGAHALVASLRRLGLVRESVFHMATAATVLLRLGPQPEERSIVLQALRLLAESQLLWWLADALPWAAWHAGRALDAARLQAWADSLVAARKETRGPLFGGMRQQLLAQLAAASMPATDALPPVPDEAMALDLALGQGTAAAVLPAAALAGRPLAGSA